MNKQKLIIFAAAGFILVLLFLIMLLSLLKGRQIKPDQPPAQPTVVPVSPTALPANNLELVSSDPANGATNVSLQPQMVLNFNRTLTNNEVIVELINQALEPVSIKKTIKGRTLFLDLTSSLQQSTVYTLRLRDKYLYQIAEVSFLTLTISPSPDTRPPEAVVSKVEEQNRLEHPDIFLANKLPVSQPNFSMQEEVDDKGYLSFTVTSAKLSGAALKQEVETWLKSLGLTEAQIKKLKIDYP